MQITTAVLPGMADSNDIPALAVVIDVLRATSVMTTAIDAGAQQIMTCRDVDQATNVASTTSPAPLLCGERKCVPVPGFDLGNSPAEYRPSVVAKRSLILTTTNGTAAIESTIAADDVIAASFLNLTAVIERISTAPTIHLICAGTDGFLSNEDILLAGAIIARCQSRYTPELVGDSSFLARQLWEAHFPQPMWPTPESLTAVLRETRGGRNLVRAGFEQDIALCSQIDSLACVPELCNRDPISFQ